MADVDADPEIRLFGIVPDLIEHVVERPQGVAPVLEGDPHPKVLRFCGETSDCGKVGPGGGVVKAEALPVNDEGTSIDHAAEGDLTAKPWGSQRQSSRRAWTDTKGAAAASARMQAIVSAVGPGSPSPRLAHTSTPRPRETISLTASANGSQVEGSFL